MPRYSLHRLYWAGPLAIVIAVLADLVYFAITRHFGEQYLIPLTEDGSSMAPLPAVSIAITVLFFGLLACFLFAFLIRFTRNPATIFLSVAITALVVSLGGPFRLPQTGLQTRLLLVGMHFLAALIIGGGILIFSRSHLPQN